MSRKDDDIQKLLGIAGIAVVLFLSGLVAIIQIANYFGGK